MAYPNPPRTWSAAAVLTAAQMNAELRDALNTIIPTASTTLAWGSFTPTLTQSATIAKTVTYAKFFQVGKIVVAHAVLSATSSGTANNAILVGLPVTASSAAGIHIVGTGSIGASNNYGCIAWLNSTTTVALIDSATVVNVSQGQTTASFAGAIASGNSVQYAVVYEAA